MKNNPGIQYPECQAEIILAKQQNGPTVQIPLDVYDAIERFI